MTGIENETAAEARRLVREAVSANVPIWLLGGAAVKVLVGDQLRPALTRKIQDVDCMTVAGARSDVSQLLTRLGYDPDEEFNSLHGAQRLLFHDRLHGRQVDVFVDRFEMCHSIPLSGRLERGKPTIPLAELLLTKLQIVELNHKDRTDLYALLLAYEVTENGDGIEAPRIASLCSADWGLFRTVEINLDRLRAGLSDLELSQSDRETIAARAKQLTESVHRVPKGLRWRMRARVGDRMTWYQEPEEAGA